LTFSTAPDTTAPTVPSVSPAANATLSGTAMLTATASDNVGRERAVQVDNANTGTAITERL